MAKKAQVLVEAVDMTKGALMSVERNLKSVNEASNSVAASFRSVLAATGGLELGRQMLSNAMQAEQASNRITAVLRATGNAAGYAKDELDDMADSLAASTQFDDESIRNAQAVFLKFGNITGGVFKDGLSLAADYAAFIGTEIPDAAQTIGKALSAPVEGLAALEKQIGKLRPEQEAMIKSFVEQGRVLEAQNMILDILRSKIGGTAEIMNSGLTGAVSGAKKAWDELMESLGKTDAIGGTAQRAMQGLATLFADMRDSITGSDVALTRMLNNAAAARAFAPVAGPARTEDGIIPGLGRFGRRTAAGATRGPATFDLSQNSFDSGDMTRALLGQPKAAGGTGSKEKSAYDRAIESLTKEAAGAGQVTKLQQMVAEISAGVYGKLNAQQALRLKQLAEEIDLGRKNKELAQEIDEFNKKAGKEYEDQALKAKKAAEDTYNKRKSERDMVLDIVDPTRKLVELQAKIGEMAADGRIDAETADIAWFKVNQQILAASGALEQIYTGTEKTNDIAEELGLTFTSAFEDAIVKGMSFRDVLKGIEQDIARIIIRNTITKPAGDAISGAVKDSSFIKAAGDFFGSMFGGGKAEGGSVSSGTPYLVGERGPELFMPGRSGTIVPNNQLGGGITQNLTINIDSRTDAATIAGLVRGAVERANAQVFTDFRGRGPLRRAI